MLIQSFSNISYHSLNIEVTETENWMERARETQSKNQKNQVEREKKREREIEGRGNEKKEGK